MDKSKIDLINDVLSGDDDPLNSNSSYESDGDSTVVSRSDEILSSLLLETKNTVKSLSSLNSYQSRICDEQTFERKPWQSLFSLKSQPSTSINRNLRPIGTSGYASGDLGIPSSSRTTNSFKDGVQTFSDTSSMLHALQDELRKTTAELHDTENEYFNLKASYENISSRFDMVNTEMSGLRLQLSSKDKIIKQLQQKVSAMENQVSRTNGDYEQMRLELEKARRKLDDAEQTSDSKNENLSSEIRRREEIIEQLRVELTQTARATHRPIENETMLKEKIVQLEKTTKQKEQQIQFVQKQNSELEQMIKNLQMENKQNISNSTVVDNLEQEIELIKVQLENANHKNDSLNETLTNSKRFYDEFKENSEQSMKGYSNSIEKLRTEYRELEVKHRDSLSTMKQQGDSNKRLIKENKELTDKLKYGESIQTNQDEKIHRLALENAELSKTIEGLKLQIIEASITETNLNKSYKNETDSRQGYIERLSQETIHLNRSIDDLKDKVRIRESTIEKLNDRIVEMETNKDNYAKSIRNLEEKLSSVTHNERILDNDCKDKLHQIEIMELEIKTTKNQYDSILEEFHKVSAEKRDIERCLRRLEENRTQEMVDRDERVQSAKSEVTKLAFEIKSDKEINQRLTAENEKMMKDLTELTLRVTKVSDDLEEKKMNLEELYEREKRLQNHNQCLEEELAQVKLALEDSNQEMEHVKNSWNYREDALESLKNEAKKQQENNLNLIQKIEQRDQLLQRLTTEATKLKQKYQEKTSESSKLNKENECLKSSSAEFENALKDWQQKFDNMVRKKESTIEQLKSELTDSQNQYTKCYETLLKKEEYLSRAHLHEKDQSTKVSETQNEISRLQADYDEMESELNMMRAKHRAYQEEMNSRDEQLNELRNELQVQERDNLDYQSERVVFQQELSRWKEKCTDIQNQLEKRVNEADILEDKLSEKDHLNDEQYGRLQIANQKLENHERTIEQLKTEITVLKSTNGERYNHFQSIISSLKNENNTHLQENQLLEERGTKYKSQILELKTEQERFHHTTSSVKDEMESLKDKLKDKDEECRHWMQQTQNAQFLNEEVKVSLDSLEKEVTFAKQQLDTKNAKLQANADTILKLKTERNQNYKNLMECKHQLESTTKDREDIWRTCEENNLKIMKYEQCIKDLTEELSTVQVEIGNYTSRISQMESELNHSSMVHSHKQALIEELECKVAKWKSNHNTYKGQFKTSETEVDNLNSLLLQQTKKCAEHENNVLLLRNERDKMLNENELYGSKIALLKDELELISKEYDRVNCERQEIARMCEEKQQKYQYEIKKMKTYARQAEDDISLSHKTIDDLNNQLDVKQGQLDAMCKKSESLEDFLDRRNREINQLELKLTSLENEFKSYRSNKDIENEKRSSVQKEIDSLQQELKEMNCKILDATNECTKYQTRCSSLEEQLRKAEKKISKYESDNKSLQSSFTGYNQEVTELRSKQLSQSDILEKTKSQYEKFFNDFNLLKEENKKEKKINLQMSTEIENLKVQLQSRNDHLKLLEEQIVEHEGLVSELQDKIIEDRQKMENWHKNEFQKKRTIQSIETETEILSQSKQELQIKLKDKERQLSVRNQEVENLNKKTRQLAESLMEKENRFKLMERRLRSSENEVDSLRENVSRLELLSTSSEISTERTDCILQLQTSQDASHKLIEQLRLQVRQTQKENTQLTIACQNKEDEIKRIKQDKESLVARYSELTSNKEEPYLSINRKSQHLEDENESLQRTIKKLRYEAEERDQFLLKNHDESTKNLTSKLIKFQNEEMEYETRLNQLKNELDYQNRQMTSLKSSYEKLCVENGSAQSELKQTKETNEKLKNENERIVDNFNSWIQEQKLANEKLGDKIRDQNKIIQELKKEKSNLERDKSGLINELQHTERNPTYSDSSASSGNDSLHLEVKEKTRTIEGLQEKLRDQMSEIAKLKEQILMLQKLNQKAVRELEEAAVSTDSSRTLSDGEQVRLMSIQNHVNLSKKATEDRCGPREDDSNSYDKQYWMRRVGDLSEELQKSKEYWSNKVREISNNLESSSVTNETISAQSS